MVQTAPLSSLTYGWGAAGGIYKARRSHSQSDLPTPRPPDFPGWLFFYHGGLGHMKRIAIFLTLFISTTAIAEQVDLHFINEDNTTYQNSTCTIGDELKVPETHPTKYGYDFVGWRPKAARELEYATFQSQNELTYIDTGIMFDSNEIEYEIKFNFGDNYSLPFGAEGICSGTTSISNSSGTISIHGNFTDNCFFAGTGRVCGNNIPYRSLNTYTLYINKTSKDIIGTINDNVYNTTLAGTVTSDKNIWLGGAGEGKYCNFSGKIYYFRIKKDGVLVLDFIPATDPDGVVCFYDKVTKTFFYKQSGPDLIAGPIKE